MSKNSIIKGTLILTAAGLLTRIIGFFYKIYLSGLIGARKLPLKNEVRYNRLTNKQNRTIKEQYLKKVKLHEIASALFCMYQWILLRVKESLCSCFFPTSRADYTSRCCTLSCHFSSC